MKDIEYKIYDVENTNDDCAVAVLEFDKIYLYPKFFQRTSEYRFDSQLGILIHEFSHHAFGAMDVESNIACSKIIA